MDYSVGAKLELGLRLGRGVVVMIGDTGYARAQGVFPGEVRFSIGLINIIYRIIYIMGNCVA